MWSYYDINVYDLMILTNVPTKHVTESKNRFVVEKRILGNEAKY